MERDGRPGEAPEENGMEVSGSPKPSSTKLPLGISLGSLMKRHLWFR
jgi:hypothetical protein